MKHPISYLISEQRGAVLWIYLNRPEVKNAFNLEMADGLLKAIRQGMKDPKVSAIVLSGRDGAFSAGGDIKRMSETRDLKRFFLQISKILHAAVLEMRRGPKPVLAAIPGYVGGVAFGLVLGADLRIASREAKFNAATIRLGLVANGGATWFLPRLVGSGHAAEILLLGEIISAEEAHRIGLVNRVVFHDNLESEAQRIAEKLASGPKKALARLKQILNESPNASLSAQLAKERQAIAWSATTEDFKEGIAAFLEKRSPNFKT